MEDQIKNINDPSDRVCVFRCTIEIFIFKHHSILTDFRWCNEWSLFGNLMYFYITKHFNHLKSSLVHTPFKPVTRYLKFVYLQPIYVRLHFFKIFVSSDL